MAKRFTNILAMGVLIIISLGVFTACGGKKLPYNAVMYGDVYANRDWMQDEFYEGNLTTGSWSSVEQGYVTDDSYPQNRTIVITDSSQYIKVFKNFPVEVDFEKTMIIIHCFTTASSDKYEIISIIVDEQTLKVKYKHPDTKGKTPPNASMPLTKWVIVLMDRLNISTAEFIFGN